LHHLLSENNQSNGLAAIMPSFHTLQYHVIARLQRDMDMRHDARFTGKQIEQAVIHLNTVKR
jgi:hypothetical protein